MKKITLFLVTLVIALGVNAQAGFVAFGYYNLETNEFNLSDANMNMIGDSINHRCLTFAVLVNHADLLDALNTDPDRLTLAFAAIRNGENREDHFENYNIRMNRCPVDPTVFYICQFDLGRPGTGRHPGYFHIHSGLIVASTYEALEAGFEFWWEDNEAAGFPWNPQHVYLGTYSLNNNNCRPCDGTASIANVIAERGEPVAEELFSLTGATLPETARGLVIVRYTFADGTTTTVKEIRN